MHFLEPKSCPQNRLYKMTKTGLVSDPAKCTEWTQNLQNVVFWWKIHDVQLCGQFLCGDSAGAEGPYNRTYEWQEILFCPGSFTSFSFIFNTSDLEKKI